MSLRPVHSSRFHKDTRRAGRRGRNLTKLRLVAEWLIEQTPLPARFRDHPLLGEFKGYRECHIEPDWLLIYRIDDAAGEIRFERTGTHSDLFG